MTEKSLGELFLDLFICGPNSKIEYTKYPEMYKSWDNYGNKKVPAQLDLNHHRIVHDIIHYFYQKSELMGLKLVVWTQKSLMFSWTNSLVSAYCKKYYIIYREAEFARFDTKNLINRQAVLLTVKDYPHLEYKTQYSLLFHVLRVNPILYSIVHTSNPQQERFILKPEIMNLIKQPLMEAL